MTVSRGFPSLPALAAGLVLAFVVGTPGARAYHTNFQGSCTNEYFNTTGVTRSQARIYAEIGASEGYQWGGGRFCKSTIGLPVAFPADRDRQWRGAESVVSVPN